MLSKLRVCVALVNSEVQDGRSNATPRAIEPQVEEEKERSFISLHSIATILRTTYSRLNSGDHRGGHYPLMAQLISGVKPGGTTVSLGKLTASGRSLQTWNRDSTRSRLALVRDTGCGRLPARDHYRLFCIK